MVEIILWLLIFAVSLTVLIKSSNVFTTSAEKIGIYLGIPSFIVGVTIVSIGTTLPELVSSVFAVVKDSSEIVIGTVAGSIITNIFLVLGVTAIISKKIKISYDLIHVDLPVLVGSSFLLVLTTWDGIFTLAEAILFLFSIFIYFFYTSGVKEISSMTSERKIKERKFRWSNIVKLIISSLLVYFGAQYTIESLIKLSNLLHVGKEILAISAMALGTSLPELVISISAARKGKAEMAVGNILGANIINTYLVMGIPSFFGNLMIPQDMINLALPLVILSTLLYFFITQDREITEWEGWMLIIFYLLFIGKIFSIL